MFRISIIERVLDKHFEGKNSYQIAIFAIMLSFSFSMCMVFLKVFAYFLTNSVAMQVSALDAVMDSFSSLIALMAVRLSSKESSGRYLFGRGKFESLAGLLQGGFIWHAALMIYYKAYDIYFGGGDHSVIENNEVGVVVLIISSILVFVLVSTQNYAMKYVESTNVRGEAAHYKSDLFMNVTVMISLIFADSLPKYFDIGFGLAVATYMLYNAIVVVRISISDLLDTALSKEVMVQLHDIIQSAPHYHSTQRLMTRSSGMKKFVSVYVCVEEGLSHAEAEEVRVYITDRIHKEIESADAMVSVIPAKKVGN